MLEVIENVIRLEGGYVNDPCDSGGETNFGITVAVACENGYTDSMESMPLATAVDIYKRKYWDRVKGDDISELSSAIAFELFDTAVNMGVGRASKFLQRSLNLFSNQQVYYPDLIEDGILGPATLCALDVYLARRSVDGESVLLKTLNVLQGAHYIHLAERRQKDEAFIYGWLKNRVEI